MSVPQSSIALRFYVSTNDQDIPEESNVRVAGST